nr:MAG TPA: hypothetical protein [Bacteriophage sp.]
MKFSVYAKLLETLINSVLERCSIQIIRCHLIYIISLQSLVQNAPKTLYFKAFLCCLVCKLHTIYTLMKFFA